MKEENKKKIKCSKCNIELITGKANFSYLGRDFSGDVLKCPECGKVYISEDLVNGKIKKVEGMFESK